MTMRGISRFTMEKLLPHSTEAFRRGTLLCFTKIPLSKNFLDKKLGRGEGREYHDLTSKVFRLTVPKISVGETFCAVFQKSSGSQKVFG